MKKRLIALFLCVALISGLFSSVVVSAESTYGLTIYHNGQYANQVELPENDSATVDALLSETASGIYQWQILADDGSWANIHGETGVSLTLRYAMVAMMLRGGTATIRCRFTPVDGEPIYSNEMSVIVAEAVPVQQPAANGGIIVNYPDPVPMPPVAEESSSEEAPIVEDDFDADNQDLDEENSDSDIALFGLDDEEPSETPVAPANYSIIINYVFTDGSQAANPWTGSIGAGMSYHQAVKSPEVVGYTPDQASVTVDITSADKDYTYTVTYSPALVSFKVEHWQQNTDNDQYTLVSTDSKTGYTESEVGEGLENEYTGFYDLLYDTSMKIAADSSTVVKIYYDRYYYLMSFDLQGGYGTDPIYARYGAAIGTVPDPIRAGYTFKGWDKDIPETMPAEKTKFTASWEAKEATLTVAFWYENANDNNYSVAGSIEVNPKPMAGKEIKSEDYKDTDFPGKDSQHFTFNAEKSETKTVDGDGSTVLNVYFTRNTYTITFTSNILRTLSCTKTEHQHSDACCKNGGTSWSHWGHNQECCTLGLEAHTHGNSCYSYYDYTVTRKYDADISDVWETDPIKSLLDDGYVFRSSLTSKYYSFLEKMPGSDITMTKTEWSGYTYTWYYYLEVPSGMSAPVGATTKTEGGRTYYLYHTTSIKGNGVNLTYDEDYFPITGFTQRDKKGENGWKQEGNSYKHSFDSGRTYSLYYLREQYNLKFINYGTEVTGKGGDFYYQQDISGTNFTPEYPATLEAGAYVFDGWYDNPFFNESGKFNFTGATMPAGPVILYAHWVPVTHNVEVYKTADMKAEDKIGETQVVSHRDVATEPATPTHPASDKYEFVGWFYLTDDPTPVEKAFDFSTPISRDMKIYAKWSSNVMVDYTIKYVLEDGTEIATATTGKNLAGTTKTFDAKVGAELNEGYQSGYFPTTNSHNLELNIEGENTYSFVYIPKEKVPYTVKYLEKDTGKVLKEEKHAETRDAVITEKFEFIQGYAPDAYQKRLILSANEEENVIIFWYVADTEHAPVQIIHWTQNISGDSYTEYTSNTILNGVIGTTYTETPKTIEGFQYRLSAEGSTYVSNPSGELTGEGLVLNLYYDRIEYPYEFKFLEQGTDKVLATSTTGNGRYQAQVTEKAKTIPGYKLVSDENQAITIAIEDPANVAKKNVKIFYYQEETIEIKYQVVGPDGCGTLSSYADQNVKVFTGTVNGSTPTANENFRFVGWYKDAACTEAVTESWVVDNKITPEKTTTIGDQQAFEAKTYYAKFEYDVADLTITKTGANETVDPDQTFIFTITGTQGFSTKVVIQGNGSVTINGLEIDTYTIHEENGWSWRYSCADQTITLLPGVTNNVTMENTRVETKWLDGNAYAENKFNQ